MDQYKGFSTIQFQRNKDFLLANENLIKQDLINHIYTRKGERVMMNDFGTRIPDLIFEPLDEVSVLIVNEDLNYVINYDPRIELLEELHIIPIYEENAILAFGHIEYTYLNFEGEFDIRIDFIDS